MEGGGTRDEAALPSAWGEIEEVVIEKVAVTSGCNASEMVDL